MPEWVHYFNFAAAFSAFTAAFLGYLLTLTTPYVQDWERRYFRFSFGLLIAYTCTDFIAQVSLYFLGPSFVWLSKAGVFCELLFSTTIIPITLVLAFWRTKKEKGAEGSGVNIKKIFPFFIIYFVLASLITTVATNMLGVPASVFAPFKEVSKFFIILAMAAIGLNTNIVKLIKTGGKPLVLGFSCWMGITVMCLVTMKLFGIW